MSQFKRFVMQFASPDRSSWTESYYHKEGTATLDSVRTAAANLLKKRVLLFPAGITILNAYVSDDDTRRDALYVPHPIGYADGSWNKDLSAENQAEGHPDYAWSVLHLQLASGVKATCHKYLSGIPDWLTFNPHSKKKFEPTFAKMLTTFFDELKASWAWKGISTDPAISVQSTISKVELGAGKFKITTDQDHQLTANDPVTISAVKLKGASVNGVQYVAEVLTSRIFYIKKTPPDEFQFLHGGFAQQRKFGLFPITEVHQKSMTSHKRGNSVGRRRGRAPKRRTS